MKRITAKELDALRLPWLEEAVLLRMAMSCTAAGTLNKDALFVKIFPNRTSLTYRRMEAIVEKFEKIGILKSLKKDGKTFVQITLESDGIEQSFQKFWGMYPKKAAKKDAYKAWKKLNPDESLTQTIIEAVKRFSLTPQWQKDNGQFIPNAATFLNGERWKDEITGAIKAAKQQRASGWDFPEREHTEDEFKGIIADSMAELGL